MNQFWLTYTRNFGGRLNTPQISLGDLGSTFNVQGPPALPQITVSGYFTLSQAIAGPVAGTNFYSMRDQVSQTHGRHTLKFGGELSLNKDIQQTLLNNYGVFSFTGTKTGNALADFLAGLPVSMNQDAPITAMDNFWAGALFVQDDFRIHPRLTLNLGLRYELQQPPTDPFNRESTFELGVQSQVLEGLAGSHRPAGARRSRRRPRHRVHEVESRFAAPRPGVGSVRRRQDFHPRRRRHLLRQRHRQRMELHLQLQSVRGAPDVPERRHVDQSLLEPAGRRVAVPVHLRSEQSAVHSAGVDLRHRAEFPVALHLPVQLLGAAPDREGPDCDGRLCGLAWPTACRSRKT